MPITWRNIENDPTRGAATLFETARRAFNDGMGNFKGIIDSRNELNQQNWNTQKEVNTDQFLDRLAQFKTPEELAAAQAAGDLQRLKAQFGGQIDRDAIRNAETDAASELMKRITTQNQYSDDTRRRGERDQLEVGRNFILNGDYGGYKKWAAENSLMDEPVLDEMARTYQRQDAQDSRAERQLGISLNRANQDNILFNQKQQEYKQKQFLGNQAAQLVNEARNYDAAASEAITATAQRMGIELDDAGMPVFADGAIGESSKRLFLADLKKQGIDPNSRTAMVNGMMTRVMSAPEMKGAGIDTLLAGRQGLMSALMAIDSLDPESQSRLDSAKEAEKGQLEVALAAAKEKQRTGTANNPYYNPVEDVEKATSNIMTRLPKDRDFFGFDDKQRRLLETSVRNALADGLSEEFVKNAFDQTVKEGTFWGDTDENFQSYLDSYGDTDALASLKTEAGALRTKNAQELRAIEAASAARQMQLERAYRKSLGLTPENPYESLRRLSSGLKSK